MNHANILEEESAWPIGSVALIPCARHNNLQAIVDLATDVDTCALCGKPMTAEHDQLSVREHIAQNQHVRRVA